jgi:hypothetical protein
MTGNRRDRSIELHVNSNSRCSQELSIASAWTCPRSHLVWNQPGKQSVGDQSYDAFVDMNGIGTSENASRNGLPEPLFSKDSHIHLTLVCHGLLPENVASV